MSEPKDDVVVFGASDDLLEVEGAIREEFANDQDEPRYVAFSNGVVLKVTCDDEGIWRIAPRARLDHVTIVFARGEDEGRDENGCPGYSDKAIVSGPVSWVVVGREWARA